jgi:hypothetical protein
MVRTLLKSYCRRTVASLLEGRSDNKKPLNSAAFYLPDKRNVYFAG